MFVFYYKLEAVVVGILEWSEFDCFRFIHWEDCVWPDPSPNPGWSLAVKW